jgi:ribosomal-protein-alanine N-acetyltransferase
MEGARMAAVETARLYLRRLQATDLDDYYQRIYADPDVMRTLLSRAPISREEFDTRIPSIMVEHWTTHGFGPWAVIHKPDNQLIGHCGLRYWPDSSQVEVLYALARCYWGKGLATEGARASLRYGFEHLRLERIIAATLVENSASQRVLEKIGMQYERTFQFRGLDAISYSFARTAYQPDDTPYRLIVSEEPLLQ